MYISRNDVILKSVIGLQTEYITDGFTDWFVRRSIAAIKGVAM